MIFIGLLSLAQCEDDGSGAMGPECFDCRCPRNLDYQVRLIGDLSNLRTYLLFVVRQRWIQLPE